MTLFLHRRLMLRFAALSILILCLIVISREDSKARFTTTKRYVPAFTQTQAPILTPENPTDAPLVLSVARPVPAESQSPEITFTVTNAFRKSIRAFAIKQDVEAGSMRRSTVSVYNLDLTNSELQPKQSLNDFSTFDSLSNEPHRVTLSVEYVEFSDGTSWGLDLNKSAERIAGQRAGADILSKRLLRFWTEETPVM